MDQIDYKIISNSNRCHKCYFRFEVVLDDVEEINISCRHPMGPGNSIHCIYFKNMDMD